MKSENGFILEEIEFIPEATRKFIKALELELTEEEATQIIAKAMEELGI